jgi:hypothetical protein
MSESRKEVEEGDSSGGPPHQRAARATWLLWLETDADISKEVSWRQPDNSELRRTLLQLGTSVNKGVRETAGA